MGGRLAGGIRPVMAGEASTRRHARVIEVCRNECRGRVTQFARVGGVQMFAVWPLQLANDRARRDRVRAVMAGEAGADRLRMVGLPRLQTGLEFNRAVACSAIGCRRQMLAARPLQFAENRPSRN